jgi:hypothetical protein
MRRGNGEGSIFYHERKRRWVGTITTGYDAHGQRRRRSVSARTKGALLERLQQLQTQHATGTLPAPSTVTLAAFLQTWLAAADLRPGTRAFYAGVIRTHVLPRLGGVAVSRLTPSLLQTTLADLQRAGVGAATCTRVFAILRTALRQAVRPSGPLCPSRHERPAPRGSPGPLLVHRGSDAGHREYRSAAPRGARHARRRGPEDRARPPYPAAHRAGGRGPAGPSHAPARRRAVTGRGTGFHRCPGRTAPAVERAAPLLAAPAPAGARPGPTAPCLAPHRGHAAPRIGRARARRRRATRPRARQHHARRVRRVHSRGRGGSGREARCASRTANGQPIRYTRAHRPGQWRTPGRRRSRSRGAVSRRGCTVADSGGLSGDVA